MAPHTPIKEKRVRTPSTKQATFAAAHKRAAPAPRRCRKCPHNPLRSQCVHTTTGRDYLKTKSLMPSSPLPSSSPLPPSSPPPPLSSPLFRPGPSSLMQVPPVDLSNSAMSTPTPLSMTQIHSNSMAYPFTFKPVYPNDILRPRSKQGAHGTGSSGISPVGLPLLSGIDPFVSKTLVHNGVPQTHPGQGGYEVRSSGVLPAGLPLLSEIDPFVSKTIVHNGVPQTHSGQGGYEARSSGAPPAGLPLPPVVNPFAFSMAPPNGLLQASPGKDTAEVRPSGTSLVDPSLPSTPPARPAVSTTSEPIGISSLTGSTPAAASDSFDAASPDPKRTRITASNPLYGLVEGAKQGNAQYAIVRTKPLRPVQPDAREAGKRFHRGMRDLIIRAENLSKETGAWIFLGGQHVNGAKGYTNYASPRLRRDAKKELTVIQNQFNTITSALISSRHREAVELSIELDQANKKHHAVQATLAEVQAALESPDADGVIGKDAFIAKLRALVAGNEGSPES